MESEVTKVENENSLLAVDVEHLRSSLFKKTSSLSELEKRCIAQEKVLEEQLRDIVQSERIIAKKTTEVEKLNKKLEKFITKEDVSLISLTWETHNGGVLANALRFWPN